MKKPISFVVLLGVAGLVVGYLLFGKGPAGYVRIIDLLSPPKSGLAGVGQRVLGAIQGIAEIRRNILASGVVGAALGLVASIAANRPRR